VVKELEKVRRYIEDVEKLLEARKGA